MSYPICVTIHVKYILYSSLFYLFCFDFSVSVFILYLCYFSAFLALHFKFQKYFRGTRENQTAHLTLLKHTLHNEFYKLFIANVYLVLIIVVVFIVIAVVVDPNNGTRCLHTIRFGSMGSNVRSQLRIMLSARQINLFN